MRKIATIAAVSVSVLLAATSGSTAQTPAGSTLVLQGGTLIDGTGRDPVTDAVVVVQGGRITAVGKRGQVRTPRGAKVVDVRGHTILPGLIDTHTHTQEWHYPMFLHYGVTTIQDKNNDPAWMLAQREALQKGWMRGPRLYTSGATIHSNFDNNPFNTPDVFTYEETKAYAQKWRAAGFDSFNTFQYVSDAQQRALIEVADTENIPVMGHVRNMRTAVGQGYHYAEHMFGIAGAVLDPEDKSSVGLAPGAEPEYLMDPAKFGDLIDFFVKHDVTINPTLAAGWIGGTPRGAQLSKELQTLASDPDLAFVPAQVRQQWLRSRERKPLGYENVAKFLKQYVDGGGHVSVGTDSGSGTVPGLSEHYEMQMLVDLGLSPMQAIQAATLWNAHLIRHDKDLGSVEVGKIGDFTIIDGDPLKDISATRNIWMVIKDGQILETRYDPKWVNPVPAPFSTLTSSAPNISKISPAIVRQNGPTVTLTIDGPDAAAAAAGRGTQPFSPQSIVRFDTSDLPTTFVSEGRLTATLDAKLLQRGQGLYPLYVLAPGVRGNVSPAAYLVVDSESQPVKVIPQPYATYAGRKAVPGSVENERGRFFGPYPRAANQGSGKDVTVRIKGTRFAPNAVVMFDNVALRTTFVSDKEVTATIDAKLLERPAGSYVMYVLNPGLYGNLSEAGYFLVALKNAAPQPALP